jgi:hypothetical protein
MFESMRVYIERNKRSYNYLKSVSSLNVKREDDLMERERETKQKQEEARQQELQIAKDDRDRLVELQNGRLDFLN